MAGEQVKLPIAPHLSHEPSPPTASPAPVHGKIVFHKTDPWCQKGWGPLYHTTRGYTRKGQVWSGGGSKGKTEATAFTGTSTGRAGGQSRQLMTGYFE